MTNKIAIQQNVLTTADTIPLAAQLHAAKDAGFDGVEVDVTGQDMDALMDAAQTTDITIAALNFGNAAAIIHPDSAHHPAVLEQLRLALTDACDLGAAGVVFSLMPDFSLPASGEKSGAERAIDLLIEHLRWLEDYANAMHVTLFIQPRAESGVLNTCADVAAVLNRRNNHPCIKIALELNEASIESAAISQHAAQIGYVQIVHTDPNAPANIDLLHQSGYTGWITAVEQPLNPPPPPADPLPTDTLGESGYPDHEPGGSAHTGAQGASNVAHQAQQRATDARKAHNATLRAIANNLRR